MKNIKNLLHIGTKCSFCSMSLKQLKRCRAEDWTAEKKLKLEANPDPHSALHEALTSKDCSAVCHLLDAGETLCSTDGIENCFVLITKFYNCECLKRVLTRQPSAIHCRGPQGDTLLMYAKHIDVMKTLFKFGPDVNACNDSGQNVLMKLIRDNTGVDVDDPSFDMLFEMENYVLDKGINVNATDTLDNSAADYLEEFDLCGNISVPSRKIDELLMRLFNKKAGERFPRVDSIGGTTLMHYARRAYIPENFSWIGEMLKKGMNPKARDKNGNNLMYHVTKSYLKTVRKVSESDFGYSDDTLHTKLARNAATISAQCFTLLSYGCELEGLDHICIPRHCISSTVTHFDLHRSVEMSVNFLSLLLFCVPHSPLIKVLPQHTLNLNKTSECISELAYFFLGYEKWLIFDQFFTTVDATVTHLLASGVNVMQQAAKPHYSLKAGILARQEIVDVLPDSLWLAGKIMLEVAGRNNTMKPYQISCKILVTLLRFWPSPPLALFMFIHAEQEPSSQLIMLKFLTRVGGRLPPGSPLFRCLKKKLKTYAKRKPKVKNLPRVFTKLHAEIPSLKELCRPAVRATLSKVTTSGLDLSSLRVLCQGEMIELPKKVEDYLNFKNQPEFCEDDLIE